MTLTIGIDASRAVKQIRTGVEQYSWEIIQAILRLDRRNAYHLYAPHLPKDSFEINSQTEWKIIKRGKMWSQLGLPKELRKNPPDVLFVPAHVIPLTAKVPSVVTIHDVAYRYFPESYSYSQRNYLNFSTSSSIRMAKKVIVPSQATKNDLIKFYPNSAKKIAVVHHGLNHEVFHPNITGDRPIPEPYILFVGRIEDKKNVRLLVEAFKLLSSEKKGVKLVLAGSNGVGFEGVQRAIRELPDEIRSLVIQTGYLPQYDMVRYLKHATIFAFPSIYEGFGLPVLEAMAVGTPVVCSNASALPEIAGNAAVILEPTKPLSWAAAFSRILNQEVVAKKMSEAGLKHATNFSWQHSAEETLKVILDAAK